MHFKSLLHVRDHAKVQGTAHHLLEHIAMHVNMHTGEAFDLTVDRLAHRLDITPQWVGQLRRRLVESGELLVKQSHGRRPNVYIIPYERCPACQKGNPKLELGDDLNPKVIPSQPQSEPQSVTAPTPKCDPPNPKVEGASTPQLARIEAEKEVKELKDSKEGSTPNDDHDHMDHQQDAPAAPIAFARERKLEEDSPYWCAACGVAIPSCGHRIVYTEGRQGQGSFLATRKKTSAGPSDPIRPISATRQGERTDFPESGKSSPNGAVIKIDKI